MTKVKNLTLSNGHRNPNKHLHEQTKLDLMYRVEKIVDSVDYAPGDYLERKDVEALCASKEWRVTIQAVKL